MSEKTIPKKKVKKAINDLVRLFRKEKSDSPQRYAKRKAKIFALQHLAWKLGLNLEEKE